MSAWVGYTADTVTDDPDFRDRAVVEILGVWSSLEEAQAELARYYRIKKWDPPKPNDDIPWHGDAPDGEDVYIAETQLGASLGPARPKPDWRSTWM